MKDSRLNQENRIGMTGCGRVGLETIKAPLEAKQAPKNVAGKRDPRPPIRPISERFPVTLYSWRLL